jgi:hypothetical protein
LIRRSQSKVDFEKREKSFTISSPSLQLKTSFSNTLRIPAPTMKRQRGPSINIQSQTLRVLSEVKKGRKNEVSNVSCVKNKKQEEEKGGEEEE